jgi:uncharacterized surface protein with fasciclin (FAS1) repeats
MKLLNRIAVPGLFLVLLTTACSNPAKDDATTATEQPAGDLTTQGQSAVSDESSQKTVVQVAAASPDHTTLVKAVTQAGLVDVLSNVGPFTVFAPVNAAFDALPAGTVDNLMKPENKAALSNILEYHVYVGVIKENMIQDGMVLNQVNSQNITINKSGNDITVNGAKVLGTAPAANGIIYVIDKVLLPPDKK